MCERSEAINPASAIKGESLKKKRGVLARLRKKISIKDKEPKPKPKPKPKKSNPAGGYSNPEPRRKRMQEIFDFGLRRKKKKEL